MTPKELLKMTVDAMVMAGPEGWCKYSYYKDANDDTIPNDDVIGGVQPAKCCILGRAALVSGLPVFDCHVLFNRIKLVDDAWGLGASNDQAETFEAFMLFLNAVLEAA